MTDHRTRSGYYPIINPKLIDATVLTKEPERAASYAAELREISPDSVKLLVSALPEIETECWISLASAKFDGALVARTEVSWIWPNLAGDWLLGCVMNPPLSDERFKTLLDSGLLERRFARREPTRIPVQVQLRQGEPRLPAVVHDLSDGGVCLSMRWDPPAARDVSIFVGKPANEVRIPLKVRWSTHVGPEYFLGCEIVRYGDILVLRKWQPAEQDHLRQPPRLNGALTGLALPDPA